jgi:hypothetical protein
LLTPAEADAAIAAALAPVSQEMVPLPACAGRILRTALHAERDAPPFDRVAMDGIAFKYVSGSQRRFRIAGIQAAGSPALSLGSAEDCFEVMTGAILPGECDTVVPVEDLHMAPMRARARSCSRRELGSRHRNSPSLHPRASQGCRYRACRASRSFQPATNSSSRARRSSITRYGARIRMDLRPH